MNSFLSSVQESTIRVLVIFTLVPIGIILIGYILKKLGARQLPQNKLEEILHKSYPKTYSLVYIILMILIIGTPILGIFIFPRFFNQLQNFLFGNGVIFLTSGSGLDFFVLLNFFGSLLLIGSLIGMVIWLISSPKFRDYLLYRQIKSKLKTDYMDSLRYFLYFSIGLYMFFAPLIYLSLHNYYAVYKDRIVVNNFFDFTDKVYTFDQLENVQVTYELKGDKKDDIHPSFIFTFSDGKKINFTEDIVNILYTSDFESRISNLYQELNSREIPLEINRPNERQLSLIIRKHSCGDRQKLYRATFQLDFPIVEPEGCYAIFNR